MSKNLKKIAGDETTHYVSERKKRVKPAPKMQPPLTPMIDVTFQLLLFFLLTMTFREAEGQILGTLPIGGPSSSTATPVVKITIQVKPMSSSGAIYYIDIGNVKIENDGYSDKGAIALSEQLQAMARAYDVEKSSIQIEPAVTVKWQYVLEVYNQAVRAKFKNISFTQPKDILD